MAIQAQAVQGETSAWVVTPVSPCLSLHSCRRLAHTRGHLPPGLLLAVSSSQGTPRAQGNSSATASRASPISKPLRRNQYLQALIFFYFKILQTKIKLSFLDWHYFSSPLKQKPCMSPAQWLFRDIVLLSLDENFSDVF